jgi:hypothetical protein
MKLTRPLALTFLLLLGAKARADFIPYSYRWFNMTGWDYYAPQGLRPEANVSLRPFMTPNTTQGSQEIIPALAIYVFGSPTTPYNNRPIGLDLILTDGPSHTTRFLNFTGTLSGTISNLNITFANPVQSVTLGKDTYTVELNPIVWPDGPDSRSRFLADLTANIFVTGASTLPVNNVPEPTSLVLIGLGLSTLGVRCRWRKVRPAGGA